MSRRRCDGVTRRDVLHLGAVGGLSLAAALRLQASQPAQTPKAVNAILIWLDGGPSHLDTFDPKPDAPAEIRGEFRAIGTNVPGIQLCEHLPLTAKRMDRIALIRGLTHELGNHDTGSHLLLTGHRRTPAVDFPSIGSQVARITGFGRPLPPFVTIPDAVESLGPGLLPGMFGPFATGPDPNRVRDLTPPEGIRFERLEDRRALVRALDELGMRVEAGGATRSRDAFYEQAHRLVTSTEARAAFRLDAEPPTLRDRYGRGRFGSACLLARRLVESGARFVTVVDRGWDMHQQIFKALPDAMFPGSGKLPSLDRAYSTLLDDLKERGLDSSTLVLLGGEFGRTPKLNSVGGRDHWPRAGFFCMSGPVRGGQVIGASDGHGEAPDVRGVRPEDIAATVYHALGIDPKQEYLSADGRPLKLQGEGTVLKEIL